MENRWCTACGNSFRPCPQIPRQSYCTEPDCQRERRRLWQQTKRRSDPDYLDNQAQAQRAWSKRNTDYWRAYREANPDYVAQNRSSQRVRNQKEKTPKIAKMDASPNDISLLSGVYQLKALGHRDIAKMNVWTVQITVLSAAQT